MADQLPKLVFKKVLLAVPPTGLYIREDRCQTPIKNLHTVTARPPIDLLYCAGVFKAEGCDCRVRDFPVEGGGWDAFRRELEEFRPDLLMLSITSPSFNEDMKAATLAHEVLPDIIVAAKGAHFHTHITESMQEAPQLDLALRGEYEETCRDLVRIANRSQIAGLTWRNNNGEIIQNEDREFIKDLDSLPFPSRELVDNSLYIRPDLGVAQTTLVTERGCPHRCIFCLAPVFSGRKVRKRSPDNVIAEIRECVEVHGIHDFLFRSDLFTADRAWVEELCNALIETGLNIRWSANSRVDKIEEDLLRLMKKAGCWLLAFGVESGSQEMLNNMRKGTKLEQARHALSTCRKAGIKSSIYILLGLPWETEDTFNKSLSFAKELNPNFLEFFYVYPFKGTELRNMVEDKGLLQPGQEPQAAYDAPSHAGLYLTVEQLAPLRKRALRAFYLRPGYIARTLLSNPSPKVLWNYLRYGIRQLISLLRRD
jgi:radical SAM superfamily enzyme YgiQ (UPF0313 family)